MTDLSRRDASVGARRSPRRGWHVDAVLFDMDGVITNTARAHAEVWKRLFDEFLESRGEPQQRFDIERDYHAFVDGRPRYDGVAAFLDSRRISLPRGDERDGAGAETICGLGNRKNRYFQDWLKRHAVEAFPATVRLIGGLRAAGVKVAVFSASRNADIVLRKAGVLDLFDAKVDGEDLASLGLPGKPDPAMLWTAASRLGVSPGRAAVVEDAVAGVEAGVRGGFGLVIGVDRGHNREALGQGGADLVVQELAELSFTPEDGLAMKTLSTLSRVRDLHNEIRARLAGRPLAVFLDYDGTLTPIVEDYTKALLSDDMRAAIVELGRHCLVAVVSGRDADVVRGFVQIEGIYYAGSHGFEIRGPGGQSEGLEKGIEFLPAIDQIEARLRDRLSGIPGHAVERKRFEVSVHYRQVAGDDVSRVETVVDAVLSEIRGLRKGHGKKVFRIQPDIE